MSIDDLICFISRAGGVWQCPLTQVVSDCKQLTNIVPGSNSPPSKHEIRDNQWLGVAVSSQGPGMCLNISRTMHTYKWQYKLS